MEISEWNKISCKRIFITSLLRFSFAEFTTFKNRVCNVAPTLLYIRKKYKANETTPKQLRKNTVQIEHGLSSKMEIILFLWAFERSKETIFSGKYLNFVFCKIIAFSFQKQRFESIFTEEMFLFSEEPFFLYRTNDLFKEADFFEEKSIFLEESFLSAKRFWTV